MVTWDRLADICASYLGKGMTVAIEGRIQTRQWDDDRGAWHCQETPTRQDRRGIAISIRVQDFGASIEVGAIAAGVAAGVRSPDVDP